MRVLVAGGRDYQDFDQVCATLNQQGKVTTIISGCARGADTLGEKWAVLHGVPVERYPALWDVHGRAAGHIRNQLMLDDGAPDLVIVFPGGKGSESMVKKARKAGVKTLTPNWGVK